ncbi:MAG: helix-turn-helix domain-containing protein, partial [Selenomonadaceae bacterium]|nr:helix-turn-helix domain-containing protein [Selenomonadaceae bacterium]
MPTISASKLRALMIRRGVGVRELAQAVGLSKTTVSEILQG